MYAHTQNTQIYGITVRVCLPVNFPLCVGVLLFRLFLQQMLTNFREKSAQILSESELFVSISLEEARETRIVSGKLVEVAIRHRKVGRNRMFLISLFCPVIIIRLTSGKRFL